MKVKGQTDEVKKPKAEVTRLKIKKKANPFDLRSEEEKYTPVSPFLLGSRKPKVATGGDYLRPILEPSHIIEDVKESLSKSNVVSITRGKGDTHKSDPPFNPPYTSIAANDGDMCQDLNPRLKAWLASYCPIPKNVCQLIDGAEKHYGNLTAVSQKVRKKVGHRPSPKKYCYLPINPVLGWRGRRPPTVADLLVDAYKKGYSFELAAARQTTIWGKVKTHSVASEASQGKGMTKIDNAPTTDTTNVNTYVDPSKIRGYPIPPSNTAPQAEGEVICETPGVKPDHWYCSCEEHIRLAAWLQSAENEAVPSQLSFFGHLYRPQELEMLHYQDTLFHMQYTTPHIDYMPDAIELEIEGEKVMAGCRLLGWFMGKVAPIERFFKRTTRGDDLRWRYFARHAKKYREGGYSNLRTLERIGKYAYSHAQPEKLVYSKPYHPKIEFNPPVDLSTYGTSLTEEKVVDKTPIYTYVSDGPSSFEVKTITGNAVKRCKERLSCEERAYKDALNRSGHESGSAVDMHHLVLKSAWKKIGSLLVPEGYNPDSGHVALTINLDEDDPNKLIRLKTG